MKKRQKSSPGEQKYPYFKHCPKLNARMMSVFTPLNYLCCMAIFDAYWKNNCILEKKLSTFVSILSPFLKTEKPRKHRPYKADKDPLRRKVKYILSTIVSTSANIIVFSEDKKFIKIPHLDKQFKEVERLSEAYRKGANITNSKKFERLSLRTKAIFNPKKNPYKSISDCIRFIQR